MVTLGNKTRHVVRYGQNNKTATVVGYSTLESAPPYAPQDCSAYKDIMQNLHWAKPMVLSLAYRTHLVNNLRGVAALLLNSVASSAGFGLTQSPDSLLAQYASSNISNSTFATDVLSLLNYPNTTAQPAPSLNTTIPNISTNNATLNHMFITCQGHSILQFSCLDAINTFDTQLPGLLTVGQRVPGKRNFDLNLPVRWISGTLQNPQHLLHQHAY